MPEPTASSKKPLHRIFTAVPPSYDTINHVITLGMDTGWRRQAALQCLAASPGRVLDICCGTGDMTLLISTLAKYPIHMVGLDFSEPMLEIAAQKAVEKAAGRDISFVNANVTATPFSDQHFDCVVNSFGFRNLTYKNPLAQPHFAEVLRLLKPGGRYVAIESSQPKSAFIRFFFRIFVRCFVYASGYFISGNREAYKYLSSSIVNFYSAEEVCDLFLKSGFRKATFKRLFFGAAAIYVATK
jgi:demethylmenaquinone methyltransferase / 2-methoxy-6-polyprenyl-1,4-benzoquinol methylase